jgi:two-component system, OmpR family, sensor kinase
LTHLNLRARVFVRHLVAVGLILSLAALGGDWIFSRMVLGELDYSLLELAQTEATAALAMPTLPPRIHEVSLGTAPPSFPRLDKFIQVVSLDDGQPVARSANLGAAKLPTPPSLVNRLRGGARVFETLEEFGDEPVRMLAVPLEIGGKAYAIQVAGSLDDARNAIRSMRRLFLVMSAAILGAVALTGAMLARAILLPIDRIVNRARVIGASALAERLPHPGGHDEMARLVETLNEMLLRIERVFEAQRRFTADASHELRSPLSRLRAELEVTLRRARDRSEYEKALRSCLQEVEWLSGLTNELLTLARLDAGESWKSQPQSVRLTPILEQAISRLAPEASRREIAFLVDARADLMIQVAPSAAALMVANVLDNAVKFSPPGSRVRIRVTPEKGTAVVAISDSGPGIPASELPHLFERFYRGSTSQSGAVPGVGLGLAICRVIMEGQGGSIGISSPRGEGATVSIRWPLAA